MPRVAKEPVGGSRRIGKSYVQEVESYLLQRGWSVQSESGLALRTHEDETFRCPRSGSKTTYWYTPSRSGTHPDNFRPVRCWTCLRLGRECPLVEGTTDLRWSKEQGWFRTYLGKKANQGEELAEPETTRTVVEPATAVEREEPVPETGPVDITQLTTQELYARKDKIIEEISALDKEASALDKELRARHLALENKPKVAESATSGWGWQL